MARALAPATEGMGQGLSEKHEIGEDFLNYQKRALYLAAEETCDSMGPDGRSDRDGIEIQPPLSRSLPETHLPCMDGK